MYVYACTMHFLSWSCFFKLGGVGTWIEYSFLDETHMCHLNEGNYVRDGHINNDKSSFWKKKQNSILMIPVEKILT
jgi:hypothetical protein